MKPPSSSNRRAIATQAKAAIGLAMIAGAIAAVDWRLALAAAGAWLVVDSLTPEPPSNEAQQENRP
jgi:hypothetical protein